jgi:hypothetical protein
MTMDIKDFYLSTPMARYEYMRLRTTHCQHARRRHQAL